MGIRDELNRWWVLTAASVCVGLLVGYGLCLVLNKQQWVDGLSNLVGAALGAAITVLGAELLATRSERRRKSSVQKQIREVIAPLVAQLKQAKQAHDQSRANDMREPGALTESWPALKDKLEAAGRRLIRIEPIFQILGPVGYVANPELRDSISRAESAVSAAMRIQGRDLGHDPLGHPVQDAIIYAARTMEEESVVMEKILRDIDSATGA